MKWYNRFNGTIMAVYWAYEKLISLGENSFLLNNKKKNKWEFLSLTVTEVGAGVNFPNDLSLVRSVDASVLIVQKVLRQSLIWDER